VPGCALRLSRTSLGVGLLALPYAFLLLGAVPATAALLAVAALSLLSCRCLAAASAATGQLGYGGVLAAQLGAWAAMALDAAVALSCLGERAGVRGMWWCAAVWCGVVPCHVRAWLES